MIAQRIGMVLTLVNLAILLATLGQGRQATASGGELPVLRGSALEIVDKQGKVRASIDVYSANKETGYPETVIFRMGDTNGKPHVKLLTTSKGATLGLLGETEPADAMLSAKGSDVLVRLTHQSGRKQEIRP